MRASLETAQVIFSRSARPFARSAASSSGERSKWSSIVVLPRPVTMMTSVQPAATASSTAYWIRGLSTSGSISFGVALVAGRKRVPKPAAGITALRIFCGIIELDVSLLFYLFSIVRSRAEHERTQREGRGTNQKDRRKTGCSGSDGEMILTGCRAACKAHEYAIDCAGELRHPHTSAWLWLLRRDGTCGPK